MDGPITRERFQQLEERIQFLESELAIVLNGERAAAIARRYNVNPGVAKFIQALHQAKGRVLDPLRLLDAIGSNEECGKTIQVYTCKARKALGYEAIETVKCIGVCLTQSGMRQIDQLAA